MMAPADSGVTVLGAIAAYNVVQNLIVSERAYVPANLAMTAGLIAVARRSGVSFDGLGLGRSRLQEGLRVGGAAGAAIGLTAFGAASTRRFDRWLLDRRAAGHRGSEAAYRSIVRFPFGTALFEEVAFRGVLESLWRIRSGKGRARLVTAFAFGAWHLLPTWRQYAEMGPAGNSPSIGERSRAALGGAALTGLSSIGFSALRELSGSVAAPWLAHSTVNIVSYLAARQAWAAAEA